MTTTTSSSDASVPSIANTNENINIAVEEMRIFHKNNLRGLKLSNVPFSSGDGSDLNDPQKYASFTGYNVSGEYGTDIDLSNATSSEKTYYSNYGTNKYCNNNSDCTGTYQSDTAFRTLEGSNLTMTNDSTSTGTTLLLCSADGTTCEDNFYTKSNMLTTSSNNPISNQTNMGGQDNCYDLCSGDTSCVAYNYYDTDDNPDTCTTYDSISKMELSSDNVVTGVKMDSGDFIEKFETISNDDSPNLSLDNTSYLDTIMSNQQTTLDNLKDLTSENELRKKKFEDLIVAKKEIANTIARSIQIEEEQLIYKNKIVYSMISLIFVAILVIIILYKIAK